MNNNQDDHWTSIQVDKRFKNENITEYQDIIDNYEIMQNQPPGRKHCIAIGGFASLFFGLITFFGPLAMGTAVGMMRGQDKRESMKTAVMAVGVGTSLYVFILIMGIIFYTVTGDIGQASLYSIGGVLFTVQLYGLAAIGGWIGASFSNNPAPVEL